MLPNYLDKNLFLMTSRENLVALSNDSTSLCLKCSESSSQASLIVCSSEASVSSAGTSAPVVIDITVASAAKFI